MSNNAAVAYRKRWARGRWEAYDISCTGSGGRSAVESPKPPGGTDTAPDAAVAASTSTPTPAPRKASNAVRKKSMAAPASTMPADAPPPPAVPRAAAKVKGAEGNGAAASTKQTARGGGGDDGGDGGGGMMAQGAGTGVHIGTGGARAGGEDRGTPESKRKQQLRKHADDGKSERKSPSISTADNFGGKGADSASQTRQHTLSATGGADGIDREPSDTGTDIDGYTDGYTPEDERAEKRESRCSAHNKRMSSPLRSHSVSTSIVVTAVYVKYERKFVDRLCNRTMFPH